MIKIHLTAHKFEMTSKHSDYVTEKIAQLDKYLPKNAQESKGSVTLSLDHNGHEDNRYVCEVVIEAPGARLAAKEATSNMFAAIDIVEAKIKSQIIKYKQKHSPRAGRGRIFVNKLLGRTD